MSNEITLEKFSEEAKKSIRRGQHLADKMNSELYLPIHLFYILLSSDEIQKIIKNARLSQESIQEETEKQLERVRTGGTEPPMSGNLIDIIASAEKNGSNVESLFVSLITDSSKEVGNVMNILGITAAILKPHLPSVKENERKLAGVSYTSDLTQMAMDNAIDPVIGRHVEVRRIINILGRRHKNHPILVGAPGVGKRSIVNALALKIVSGNVSKKFSGLRVITLDASKMVSGARTKAEIETRKKKAIGSIKPESTILFINGVESIVNQPGNTGGGEILSSLLARDNLRIITSTTPEAFKKLSDKETTLSHQFTPIHIEPPTVEEAMEVLRGIAVRYEDYHGVKVGEPAIQAAVKLAKRYLQKHSLPDSAIDLLDEASARKKFEIDGMPASQDMSLSRFSSLKAQLTGLYGDEDRDSIKSRDRIEEEIASLSPVVDDIVIAARARRKNRLHQEVILTAEDIAGVIQDWTGIPAANMLQGESDKMGGMEETISKRIIGQDEAVKAISKAVRRSRLGLRDLNKPIGSFLFLGSSGVGKTEISKALSQFLFDDDKSMIRFDMSEFMEKHTAQRLIGAPPGYAQADEGGQLTEAVSKNPYSVLLFDEIEKSHPDVFNLLLQVLDDGRLTDGRGKIVDFTNTVIIMTSNIGSRKLLELPSEKFSTPEGIAEVKAGLQGDLREHLRPELLNRIDEIVIFQPLSKSMLFAIADIEIAKVNNMLVAKEIQIQVDSSAKNFLVDVDFLPQYGARPLKRAILKYVQDVIGERIMSGETKAGDVVGVSLSGERLTFKNI